MGAACSRTDLTAAVVGGGRGGTAAADDRGRGGTVGGRTMGRRLSRVHLLQFDSAAVAEFFRLTVLSDARGPAVFLRDAQTVGRDDAYKKAVPKEAGSAVGGWFGSGVEVYKETGSEGALSVRYAYVFADDTVALIVHSRPDGTVPTAFHQSVALQQQLLG
ncbi:hypothetical protein OEIGOIKO_03521 [Streptomyces chrestomyceticus JCM 4735]|uniref:Uncharacterized protein n=1 Tax=Streptomyces chrestomyceticus JCM 4735 TaxID=1306181 RepID=A0A7U9KUS2_9ACTN|nr:hypothetical protein [Streptomyces chrestomyceticus]GCD35774.1 hypothetical protein OEIGOIKO_03521 [Streptomyces chrestomyceticus JCM 4735]